MRKILFEIGFDYGSYRDRSREYVKFNIVKKIKSVRIELTSLKGGETEDGKEKS